MTVTGMIRVGLVACGKSKAAEPGPARSLYTSGLFRAASAHAAATYDHWFVISAAHRLVHPDKQLRPYDLSLSEWRQREREGWGHTVCLMLQRRLRELGASVPTVPLGRPWPHPPQVAVFIHAGRLYDDALRFGLGLFPCEVVRPMSGLGIGEQLAWYKERLKAPRVDAARTVPGD